MILTCCTLIYYLHQNNNTNSHNANSHNCNNINITNNKQKPLMYAHSNDIVFVAQDKMFTKIFPKFLWFRCPFPQSFIALIIHLMIEIRSKTAFLDLIDMFIFSFKIWLKKKHGMSWVKNKLIMRFPRMTNTNVLFLRKKLIWIDFVWQLVPVCILYQTRY